MNGPEMGKRETQCEAALERLRERIFRIDELLAVLFNRLDLVARSEPPTVGGTKPPEEERVPLAQQLHELADKVEVLGDAIGGQIRRLEI